MLTKEETWFSSAIELKYGEYLLNEYTAKTSHVSEWGECWNIEHYGKKNGYVLSFKSSSPRVYCLTSPSTQQWAGYKTHLSMHCAVVFCIELGNLHHLHHLPSHFLCLWVDWCTILSANFDTFFQSSCAWHEIQPGGSLVLCHGLGHRVMSHMFQELISWWCKPRQLFISGKKSNWTNIYSCHGWSTDISPVNL